MEMRLSNGLKIISWSGFFTLCGDWTSSPPTSEAAALGGLAAVRFGLVVFVARNEEWRVEGGKLALRERAKLSILKCWCGVDEISKSYLKVICSSTD